MKFKRSLKAEPGIDLTSLIDIVFLLLIFFVVTTTFTKQSNLAVNLPVADAGLSGQSAVPRIEILVARNGAYTVNGRLLPDNSFATLSSRLQELSGGDSSITVALSADAETEHQSVVTALDALARLGISQLSITTRQRDGN
ncbi:MAG: biopolymer transporter ExbD [Pseudomonadales bacterium]|jgi:biopolymer transport protein ExbD|nr:biopolymer transporter ExbD [Pseudomonadales bacterium]